MFAFKNQSHQERRTDKGIENWEGHSNNPQWTIEDKKYCKKVACGN